MSFKNLDFQGGGANPSGIKSTIYAVLKSEITKFPEVNAAATTPQEEAGYKSESDFTLAAGKKWRKIYTTQGVGKVETEPTGEDDCQCIVNKGTFKYPDVDDTAKAFINASLNSAMVAIVPHYTKNGVRYAVIGGQDFDAKITNKGNSGDKPGSAKGIDIEISAPDYMALPNYLGVIETDDGSLNCATGMFTPTPVAPPSGE